MSLGKADYCYYFQSNRVYVKLGVIRETNIIPNEPNVSSVVSVNVPSQSWHHCMWGESACSGVGCHVSLVYCATVTLLSSHHILNIYLIIICVISQCLVPLSVMILYTHTLSFVQCPTNCHHHVVMTMDHNWDGHTQQQCHLPALPWQKSCHETHVYESTFLVTYHTSMWLYIYIFFFVTQRFIWWTSLVLIVVPMIYS